MGALPDFHDPLICTPHTGGWPSLIRILSITVLKEYQALADCAGRSLMFHPTSYPTSRHLPS